MEEKEVIRTLIDLLSVAIDSLREHGDETTLPYLESRLEEIEYELE